MTDDTPGIRFAAARGVGRVTLDRPRALNALTLGMVRAMDERLRAWADDPDIREVLVCGAGERAFCAGGDIRTLYDQGATSDDGADYPARFFRDEFRLNRLIGRYPKPYVALLDGITMGGGVGLSVHGRYRVATPRTDFAMPETGIGYFPDVGGGYFLAQRGAEGRYLALTGARIGPADTLRIGAATHYLNGEAVAAFLDRIGGAPAGGLLDELAGDPCAAPLAENAPAIERCFSAPGVGSVVAALEAESGAWAGKTLAALRRKSPTSVKVTDRLLARARGMTLEDDLKMEYRVAQRFMSTADFFEGVRALLVDKDGAPAWSPSQLEDVDDDAVEAFFAPLAWGELDFGATGRV